MRFHFLLLINQSLGAYLHVKEKSCPAMKYMIIHVQIGSGHLQYRSKVSYHRLERCVSFLLGRVFIYSSLSKNLKTLGDKSRNSLAIKPTLILSGPYRRIRPAKLTNHSARTICDYNKNLFLLRTFLRLRVD